VCLGTESGVGLVMGLGIGQDPEGDT
jgi:hypothetical protein